MTSNSEEPWTAYGCRPDLDGDALTGFEAVVTPSGELEVITPTNCNEQGGTYWSDAGPYTAKIVATFTFSDATTCVREVEGFVEEED